MGSGSSWVAGSLFDIHVDLEGDLDCDCDVDGYDLWTLEEAFITYNIAADFNGDDFVDAED